MQIPLLPCQTCTSYFLSVERIPYGALTSVAAALTAEMPFMHVTYLYAYHVPERKLYCIVQECKS